MLNINEILKISNDMDVEIRDSTCGKHYIINESGEEVEFNTKMLMTIYEQSNSYKMDFKISMDYNNASFTSNYNLSNFQN